MDPELVRLYKLILKDKYEMKSLKIWFGGNEVWIRLERTYLTQMVILRYGHKNKKYI